MNLESSSTVYFNIKLHGQKLLLVDDLIASGNPETDSRVPFTYNCRLKEEDIYFANAYEPAFEIIKEHPEIKIALIDMRIPQKSEDLNDFNPDDPTQGWGSTLLNKLREKYSKEELGIIVITAYDREELSNPNIIELSDGYYQKPLDYDALIKKIIELTNSRWKKTFDYDSLDVDSSLFIQEKTAEIRKLVKRSIEDTIKIGHGLIEVKGKLGHGKFLNWLETEFDWSYRTAGRFMQIAENFEIDEVSNLDITYSALYTLAAPSTPEKAKEEALSRAKRGESISTNLARKIKKKYLEEEQNIAESIQSSSSIPVQSKISNSVDVIKEEQFVKPKSKSLELPKLESFDKKQPKVIVSSAEPVQILSVRQNIGKNSFWNLGDKHKLFCGDPREKKFLDSLPTKIALVVNLPPEKDRELIPYIESEYDFDFFSKYKNPELETATIEKIIQETVLDFTDARNFVVFSYLFHLQLLDLVDRLECNFYVAEPDLSKCENLIEHWRKKVNVIRLPN